MDDKAVEGITRVTGSPANRAVAAAELAARRELPVVRTEPDAETADRPRATGPAVVYAKYTVDRESGMVAVKIIDSASEEVVRQIPAEEALRSARRLRAFLRRHRPELVSSTTR